MNRTLAVFVAVVAVSVTSACSSSSGKPAPSLPISSSPTSAAPFATTYGQDAALVAEHITGCTGVAAGGIGNGAAGGLVGKATCSLFGHQVVLYTWASAADQVTADQITGSTFAYYATGKGWDAAPGDSAAPDAEKAIAQAVATALSGTVATGTGS